jgi:dinuclear metal center YbgI/SA1388 family protein
MLIRDVVGVLESIAPLSFAESWDRVGLLVGDESREVRGPVLLTIDLTPAVLDEAQRLGAGFVVSYHPPIWEPMSRMTAKNAGQRLILHAIERGIAVYSPHTALDAVEGGISDWLCEGLSGADRAGRVAGDCRALVPHAERPASQEVKLVTFVPESDAEKVRHALATAGAGIIGAYTVCSFNTPGFGTFLGGSGSRPSVGVAGQLETVGEVRLEMVCSKAALPLAIETLRRFHPYEEPAFDVYELLPKPRRTVGMGRRLVLDRPATMVELGRRLKAHLNTATVLAAVPPGRVLEESMFSHIGVIPGAGASLMSSAIADHCEVFVTGEMKHHEVNELLRAGVAVLLGGHTPTERGYLPRLAAQIEQRGLGLRAVVSATDRDPLIPV